MTKRIEIELGSNGRGSLKCVGGKSFSCLARMGAPYMKDVTVEGTEGKDKFKTRRSVEHTVDLKWVIVMDGNKGYWIHAGDVSRETSAGCINLTLEDAKSVYDWVDGRTRITVTAPWLP